MDPKALHHAIKYERTRRYPMTNSSEYDQLDDLDRMILAELCLDGRMSVTELAKKLGLSKTACSVRVGRLVSEGIIVGFRAVLDPKKMDQCHVAFVEIKLEDTTEAALKAFDEAVGSVPELEQCHLIAGSFDYLLKVRTKDMRAYRQVLVESISELPHVASVSTYLSMETVKEIGLNPVL
jgi:Lrp/AsnC family leucine-responsive transcriptional regulator